MKKLLFIYNSHAGTGVLRPSLADVLEVFVAAGYEVITHPTQNAQDGFIKTKDYVDEIDLIVCSGGDGTLNEIVNGMVARDKRIPIGYIPAGTTNDFAKSMRIPRNMLQAAEVAVNGIPFSRDVGKFNDNYFTYVAAFGIFTDVSYQTDQDIKNVLGHLAYVLEGAKRIFNVPSVAAKVTYEDHVIEDEFVLAMVTNALSVGGFKGLVLEDAVFNDGLFEVSLIKTPKNPKELNDIVSAIVLKNITSDIVLSCKTNRIEFEFEEETQWTLDGECGGKHKHVVIENKKELLEFMVPTKEQEELNNSFIVF
jgi:YegS/Rv2252/BmrU family lipid kinase